MEGEGGERPSQFQSQFLWGWGAGTDGQLGTGTLKDELLPQSIDLTALSQHTEDGDDDDECPSSSTVTTTPSSSPVSVGPPPAFTVSRLACGGAHTIALTSHGRVFTWGRGTHGQLGHCFPKCCAKPRLLKYLKNVIVTSISAGWNHSGFVTDDGRLLTCGDGSFGQLGHGDYRPQFLPTMVSFFVSKNVNQIACGMRHSLVLVKGLSRNFVYSFGSGRHGQLGISLNESSKMFSLPQTIVGFEAEVIDWIFANGDHSAALSSDRKLFIWGRAFEGKLKDYLPIKLPLNFTVSQVVLGWNHALLLTDRGKVFMVGGNLHGKLGDLGHAKKEEATLSPNKHATTTERKLLSFERIPIIDGEKVLHVAAGSEHSVMVTESGKIMTWGWGEHGQLGLGDVLDQTVPQVVDIGWVGTTDPTEIKVYCGSGFTFVIKDSGFTFVPKGSGWHLSKCVQSFFSQ